MEALGDSGGVKEYTVADRAAQACPHRVPLRLANHLSPLSIFRESHVPSSKLHVDEKRRTLRFVCTVVVSLSISSGTGLESRTEIKLYLNGRKRRKEFGGVRIDVRFGQDEDAVSVY